MVDPGSVPVTHYSKLARTVLYISYIVLHLSSRWKCSSVHGFALYIFLCTEPLYSWLGFNAILNVSCVTRQKQSNASASVHKEANDNKYISDFLQDNVKYRKSINIRPIILLPHKRKAKT